jgi:hypothetical protein
VGREVLAAWSLSTGGGGVVRSDGCDGAAVWHMKSAYEITARQYGVIALRGIHCEAFIEAMSLREAVRMAWQVEVNTVWNINVPQCETDSIAVKNLN